MKITRGDRLAGVLAVVLAAPGAQFIDGERTVAADGTSVHRSATPMQSARDPAIAVREEYEAAVAKGTTAALQLFVERHPEHPLAQLARDQIRKAEEYPK